MTIQENWALPMTRIEAYLRSLDEARQIAEDSFPRTLVTFFGEEEAVTRFHRQFMIRFLTLGG